LARKSQPVRDRRSLRQPALSAPAIAQRSGQDCLPVFKSGRADFSVTTVSREISAPRSDERSRSPGTARSAARPERLRVFTSGRADSLSLTRPHESRKRYQSSDEADLPVEGRSRVTDCLTASSGSRLASSDR